MVSFKSILWYFVPRRIRLKDTLLCIFVFILILILIDDHLNNNDDSERISENGGLKEDELIIYNQNVKKEGMLIIFSSTI
jgi:hypothetical protein